MQASNRTKFRRDTGLWLGTKLTGYEYDESFYNLTGTGTLLTVDSNYMDFSGLQFYTDSETEDAVILKGQRITMEDSIVRGGRYRFDSAGANAALDKLAKINGDYEKDNKQKTPEGSGTVTINVMSPADLEKMSDKELERVANGDF